MGDAPLRTHHAAIGKRLGGSSEAGRKCGSVLREYLTGHEIEAFMAAARQNRSGHRYVTMIIIGFRHGLQASDAVDLVGIR